MELGAILVVLAVLALVTLILARPLTAQTAVEVTPAERRLSALRAEQDRLLGLIQDLDADHLMRKISVEEHAAQRPPLVQRAAEVLREIDGISPVAPAGDALDDEIEAAVRRLRGLTDAGCPACGAPLQPGDRFCSRCGAALTPGKDAG
jgi:hypothetical protein